MSTTLANTPDLSLMREVRISAKLRTVNLKTGKALSIYEEFTCNCERLIYPDEPKEIVREWAGILIKFHYYDHFVNRLRTELDLKRFVGGQKWAIEFLDLSYKIYNIS